MSLPNSLFLASREAAIAHVNGDTADISGLYAFGGITDLDISNLFSIVADEAFDFDQHEILPLDEDTEVELFELPDRLVGLLAGKSSPDLPAIAAAWAATEELDCDPADLEPLVAAFAALCAAAQGKRVYFTC